MIKLRGVYTALITPFTADGAEVDLERLAAHVRHQAAGGVQGVVPCGTTGESPTLSDTEQRRVIEAAVEAARPLGLAVVAGAGSNSTHHAVELHRFAAGAGADASLQVVPYYNKPSAEGLYRHFTTIADACDLPVVLYNIPGRTAIGMSIELIERLAAHPNIVAIKEASGSLQLAAEVTARTGLALLSGDDPITLALAAVGGVGVVSVLSNLLPAKVAELCEAFLRGDHAAARAVHERLLPLASGLLALGPNPVPVKTAMELLGRDSGALRLPLCPAEEPVRRAIGDLIASAGLVREATSTVAATR